MLETISSKRFGMRVYVILAFYLFSIFFLALMWEFKLEAVTMSFLGLPYEGDFEAEERWRFVMTSTSFAVLAMVVPLILVHRLLRRLRRSYVDLLEAQMHSDGLARYDPLSGLLNRRAFGEHLTHVLREPQSTAIFLIDLDNFKSINDRAGHAAGDAAICAVAESLREVTVGRQVALARLGGDEFAVTITGDFSRADLAVAAEDLLQRISRPINGWPAIQITASMGIAVAPVDGSTPESLLPRADIAMYRSKQDGGAEFNFFKASFEAEQREQALLEQELRAAIAGNQIQPFYQPFVKLPEQSLHGFEILARWQHPTRGTVMPDTFIGLTEKLQLIKPLTESLLIQAFADARDWPQSIILAINVTSSMIEDPDFPEWIRTVADQGSFPLRRLEIEITESAFVADLPSAQRSLSALHVMGVSISLDDFGTGYSGLYHLTQLSIDKIKIDRSFLDSTKAVQNEIVQAILALGKSLNMKVTAEGVEHEQVISWLADNGCDFAQGYLFGRPVPSSSINDLLGHAFDPVNI
ncbi:MULTISPECIES: bifunctional diguanylate cyclase/phosphodiesterase [unclassified Pseudomonas]|uniref:putative bifunctional diguanylate cyclase/phosphodiesterase n=1 Tax=unclassified Pseudomonas TaxID=196821 RepID=UPI00131B1B77|nr:MULTISPECIES: EAL domain-containing protein [unclassified Pseudomonas]